MRATIVDFKAEKHEISWEVVCESMGISQYIQWNTALTDTPEMRPSTIMRILRSIRNAISIDFHAIRPPEMQTPRCFIKRTLGLAQRYHCPYKLTLIIAGTLAIKL